MNPKLLAIPFLIAITLAAGCGSNTTAVDPVYEIHLTSSYNRQAGQLVLDVLHSADASIQVSFVSPLWVTILITGTRQLADGRLLMDLDVILGESDVDVTQITIIATDDFGTHVTRDLVVSRPVFISELSATPGPDSLQLDVTADAPGTNGVAVTVTPPAGFTVLESTEQTGMGNSSYRFDLAYPPEVILAGGSGSDTLHIRVEDDLGHEYFEQLDFTYDVAAPVVPGHSLAAIPLKSRVRVGEPVMVAVVCGDFPVDLRFLNLSGCGVTFSGDVNYVWPSFNCGMPGGEYDAIDGIWSLVQPSGLEASIAGQPNPHRVMIDDGSYRLDFGIEPVGGTETRTGGVLFTFKVTFATVGEVNLGFQEFEHVKRTYYQDTEDVMNNWAVVDNDYPGLANSIVVVE